MLLDLIDLSKLRRAIVYAALLAGVFVVQDLFASQLPLFGVRPVLIPAAVVAIGLLEGGMWGGFLGLGAGFFADMGYTEQLVLFTILLPAAGFLCGALGKYQLHKGFMSYIVLTALTLGILALCQMSRFLFFTDTPVTRPWAVWRTGLIQTGYSLLWAIPVYLPCKLISDRPMRR